MSNLSVLTLRELAALSLVIFGFALGLGFAWGRHVADRALDVAYDDGKQDGYDQCAEDYGLTWRDEPEPEPEPALMALEHTPSAAERAMLLAGLAPEALDAAAGECVCGDINSRHCPVHNDVSDMPRLEAVLAADRPGRLTPAQRRRDKHKQRGEYAPAAADFDARCWNPCANPDPRLNPARCGPCHLLWNAVPEVEPWSGDEPYSIDWTGELAAIRLEGQTEWFTRMMAEVA